MLISPIRNWGAFVILWRRRKQQASVGSAPVPDKISWGTTISLPVARFEVSVVGYQPKEPSGLAQLAHIILLLILSLNLDLYTLFIYSISPPCSL